jgi:hypothetical protein
VNDAIRVRSATLELSTHICFSIVSAGGDTDSLPVDEVGEES